MILLLMITDDTGVSFQFLLAYHPLSEKWFVYQKAWLALESTKAGRDIQIVIFHTA